MSDLTIPNEVTEIEYTVGSTSSNGPFTIPFSFFADGDVKVSVNDGTTTTLLTLINDYSVAGVAADGGFDGGSVTLVASISNSTIKIYRDIIIDRTSNFPSTGPFNIDALNTELNKAIAIMQELRTQKDSFLFVPAENISTDPFDANGRAIDNIGELSDDDAAATEQQRFEPQVFVVPAIRNKAVIARLRLLHSADQQSQRDRRTVFEQAFHPLGQTIAMPGIRHPLSKS